jgi:ferric-dicitrate binding protein FerR (iron transport regulator)
MREPFDLARLRDARPASPVVRRIVHRALESGKRRRVPWALLLSGAALTAAGLFLVVSRRPAERSPLELTTGALAEAKGAELSAAAGRHAVEITVGSAVRAARVEPVATELRVERGSARFSVAHLGAGERFRVEAGAIVVEAVGTRFAVELEGLCARVQVSEGTVRIERPGREPELQSVGPPRAYCAGSANPSVFTEEEQLVSDALTRIRRGGRDDLAAAAALLRGYHQRFPEGVYSQEALYYLARIASLLEQDDEARSWTHIFLERFPQGSRADELRELVR